MIRFLHWLGRSLQDLKVHQRLLLAGSLGLVLCLPLVERASPGKAALQVLVLSVFLQLLVVLDQLHIAWGWWAMLRNGVALVVITWAAYAINLRSGYPFGTIQFSKALQPQVMGVPVLVPMLWLLMLPPAWAVARLATRKIQGCLGRLGLVLTSELAFTGWGMYINALFLRLGWWSWRADAEWLGFPAVTLLGWGVVSVLLTFALGIRRLPAGVLVSLYSLNWLLGLAVLLLMGVWAPATWLGFTVMGALLLWATLTSSRS